MDKKNVEGCPNELQVVHIDTASSSTNIEDVLHDNCNEDNSGWIAPKNAVDEEAELVINLGCFQRIISVQMKNLNVFIDCLCLWL